MPNTTDTEFYRDADLTSRTTFGVHAVADLFITCHTIAGLKESIAAYPDAFIIGGGSNVLLTNSCIGTVIQPNIVGIDIVQEHDEFVQVRVGAGVVWHSFVTWCVEHDLGGLENLALIPGSVGAAPIQNIGAYGREQEQCFIELLAVNRYTGNEQVYNHHECEFGYRTSIFKTHQRNQHVIAAVTYQLSKRPHTVHAAYKDVQAVLHGVEHPTISDIFNAVVEIRREKLPDPQVVGNAGSFFKNPIVPKAQYNQLLSAHSDIPHYTASEDTVKVPAAWLIDRAGWKGYRKGAVGVHPRQALVLVNYGGAIGREILNLALEIQQSVHTLYGIMLEMEVNLW